MKINLKFEKNYLLMMDLFLKIVIILKKKLYSFASLSEDNSIKV